jgi:broad specificity phosphatase PhoE
LRLLLIRHGETPWNATGRSQGQTDTPLSDVGIGQAARLGSRLAGETISTIVSSDLERAWATADQIAAHHGEASRARDPRLREMSLGDWEGLHTHEILGRFAAEREAWQRDPETFRMPNGESFSELTSRVTSAIADLVDGHEQGQTIVVVSHGYALLSFFVGMLEMPVTGFRRLWLDPTGVSEVRVHGEDRVLRRFNDTSHLEER